MVSKLMHVHYKSISICKTTLYYLHHVVCFCHSFLLHIQQPFLNSRHNSIISCQVNVIEIHCEVFECLQNFTCSITIQMNNDIHNLKLVVSLSFTFWWVLSDVLNSRTFGKYGPGHQRLSHIKLVLDKGHISILSCLWSI